MRQQRCPSSNNNTGRCLSRPFRAPSTHSNPTTVQPPSGAALRLRPTQALPAGKTSGSNRRMADSTVRYGTLSGSAGCNLGARLGTMPACCKPSRSVCMQNKPSKAARELHKATKRARKARKQIERELAQWARWQLIRYFMWALVFCLGGFTFCTILWGWWR